MDQAFYFEPTLIRGLHIAEIAYPISMCELHLLRFLIALVATVVQTYISCKWLAVSFTYLWFSVAFEHQIYS